MIVGLRRLRFDNRRASVISVQSARRCSADATASSAATTDASSVSDPSITFYPKFVVSQIDYHELLVKEAHKKHNVPLNIPPQLNPPTDAHVCVYCDTLGMKMQQPERHFAFQPLHGPPPRLPEMEPKIEKRGGPLPPPKPADKKPAPPTASPTAAATQLMSDDKPFRCSACGKLFRMRPAADQHVSSQHAGVDGVKVEELNASSSAAAAASASTEGTGTSATAPEAGKSDVRKSTLSNGPNPLLDLMANMGAPADDAGFAGLSLPGEPAIQFNLPTEDEIDRLLVSTWDAAGKKAHGATFIPATSFSIGNTDPEVASRDGAAGSTLMASASTADDPTAPAPGAVNPLASHMARAGLKTGGFTSPFINSNNFATPMPTTHTTARLERKFKCGECPKAFRLFDAAVNHYLLAHGCEPSPEKMAEFKALDNPGNVALKHAAEEAKAKAIASERVDDSSNARETDADGKGRSPIPIVDVSAHVRAPSNATMVGVVRELQFGYVKADPVAQILLQVDTYVSRRTKKTGSSDVSGETPLATADQATDATVAAGADVGVEEVVETEFITVRCFGDHYAGILRPSMEEGKRLLVTGSFKLNFQVDPVAKEPYAFPYIKVVPPYGDVMALED